MPSIETIEKYFKIANIIKNRASVFGVKKELEYDIIGAEFNIKTKQIINSHHQTMINMGFLVTGMNGIKASQYLTEEYEKFKEKNKGVI